MRIEHIGFFGKNLEKAKEFYKTFFKGQADTLYHHFPSDNNNKLKYHLLIQRLFL